MLKLLKAERMKLKRSPMWLVFFLMPVLPAVFGTLNYLGNLDLLTGGWMSLWTQHTLFTCYFFLPVTIGVYCAYLMRLEHGHHNWNKVLTMPYGRWEVFFAKLIVSSVMIFLTEVWIGILYVVSGYAAGFRDRPPAALALWCLFGTLGGAVMAAIQLLVSMYVKSFAVPVGVSFAGGLSGLFFLSKHMGHVWPYSLMAYGMSSNAPQKMTSAGYVRFVLTAGCFLAALGALGAVFIRKRDI